MYKLKIVFIIFSLIFSYSCSKDQEKIVLVKENIAAKHMDIGRFYLENKKYIAALNRFKIVVDNYSITKFTPEALHRMVEVYFAMGMYEDSYNTCLLYTSPSPRDGLLSRMPSSA